MHELNSRRRKAKTYQVSKLLTGSFTTADSHHATRLGLHYAAHTYILNPHTAKLLKKTIRKKKTNASHLSEVVDSSQLGPRRQGFKSIVICVSDGEPAEAAQHKDCSSSRQIFSFKFSSEVRRVKHK